MHQENENPGALAGATGAEDKSRTVTKYPTTDTQATPARRWPHGAYVTVRHAPEEWVVVVALDGAVLGRVTCASRESAFGLACNYAERHDLPCLVSRGGPQ